MGRTPPPPLDLPPGSITYLEPGERITLLPGIEGGSFVYVAELDREAAAEPVKAEPEPRPFPQPVFVLLLALLALGALVALLVLA